MINFLALGDWGRQGTPRQQQVAHQMGRIADSLSADFVVSTGDNFYDDGVQGLADPHWRCSFQEVYTSSALQIPWYNVLGNHDYRGSVEAQIKYTATDPRWQLPARFYSVVRSITTKHQVRFVFLDTTPFAEEYRNPASDSYLSSAAQQDTTAQLRWLESTLKQSNARWNIVVGHHPIFSSSPCHGDTEELIQTVLPILEKYRVQVYLCGHDHNLQHLKPEGGIHHFVSGAASEVRETQDRTFNCFTDACCGFLAASLTPDHLQVHFFNVHGEAIHTTLIQQKTPSTYVTLADPQKNGHKTGDALPNLLNGHNNSQKSIRPTG